MLLELLQNPEQFSICKTQGESRNYEQYEGKRVCLAMIQKMSHFQYQIMSQFFQTFVLCFPQQDPGWPLNGEVNCVEKQKRWLHSVRWRLFPPTLKDFPSLKGFPLQVTQSYGKHQNENNAYLQHIFPNMQCWRNWAKNQKASCEELWRLFVKSSEFVYTQVSRLTFVSRTLFVWRCRAGFHKGTLLLFFWHVPYYHRSRLILGIDRSVAILMIGYLTSQLWIKHAIP